MKQRNKLDYPLRPHHRDADQESADQRREPNTETVAVKVWEEMTAARRPWYQTRRWGSVLLLVYAFMLLLFGVLAGVVHFYPILAIDVTITHLLQENQSAWLRFTMMGASVIGDMPLLSAALVAFAAMVFWLVDLRLEAILVVTVSVTSDVLDALIKALVARPRPTSGQVDIIAAALGNSFPSGHVMSYVAFWGLLFSFGCILFKGRYWWRIVLLVLSGLLVVLVGPSRVYLGAHWTSDVLGAYLLSGACLGIGLWVYLRLKGRGVLPQRPVLGIHLRKYLRR